MTDSTELPSSYLIQTISEEQFEIVNSIKPQLITALHENLFLWQLHQELEEKSKRMRFNDRITHHPQTSVDLKLNELFSCYVSEWYNEFLEDNKTIVSEKHRCEYPLNVLLPIVLESMGNYEIISVDSERKDTGHDTNKISDHDSPESDQYNIKSELESLRPVWQGEFNDISHINTC